ncbi:MAG: hypothetical protein AAGA33_06995 [Pseudomonadota bacterium]
MPLLALIPLLGYTLTARRRLALDTSFSLVLAVSGWLVLVYAFGLVGLLREGAVAIWVVGAVLFLVELPSLVAGLRQRQAEIVIGLFVLFCLAFWFVHHDSQYFFFDEYAHWGVFIKDMWYFDRFWLADTNAWHPHYVPGAPVWQYALTVFAPEVDASAYFAQFILLIAPLMVMFDRLGVRQAVWFVAVIIVAVIGLANFGHSVASLYVDHAIATWFAGVLLIAAFQRDLAAWKLALLFPSLVLLALLKDVGIGFALAAAGLISAIVFARQLRDRPLGKALATSAAVGIVLLLPSLLAVTAWSANRDAAGVASSSYSLSGVVKPMLSGAEAEDPEEAEIIRQRFWYVFQHQQLSKDEVSARYNAFSFPIIQEFQDAFRLTTLNFYLLFALFFVIALAIRQPTQARIEWGILAAGLLFTALSYTLVMYISYLVAFGERGVLISSYIRYVHSIVLAMFLVGFAALLPQSGLFADRRVVVSGRPVPVTAPVFAVLAMMMLVFETPYLRGFTTTNQVVGLRQQMEPLMAELRERFADERVWLFLPNDQPNGIFGQILQFQIAPASTTVERSTAFLGQDAASIREAVSAFDVLWFPTENAELDERVGSVLGLSLDGRFVRVQRGPDGETTFELYAFD